MLKHLSRVRVEFNPFDSRSAAALEFLAQCNSRRAQESNPKCEVTVKRRTDDHPPFVKVTFANGLEEVLSATQMSAQAMRRFVFERAERMEVEQLFREAGLPWPVVIPEEEAAAAAAARGTGRGWRPRVEKVPRE